MQEGGAPQGGSDDSDIRAALAQLEGAEVRGSEEGIPYSIRGRFGRASRMPGVASPAVDVGVREALRRVAPVFRLSENDLVFKRATVDAQGHQHLRFQQTRNGLRVVGGELMLHLDEAGRVYAANGSARDGSRVAAEARVAPEAALRVAVDGSSAWDAAAEGAAKLVYLRPEHSQEPRLAYEVRVKGERDGLPADDLVYVDAQRGGVLEVHPLVHSVLHRTLYTANNGTATPGTRLRSEGQAPVGDTHADTNYDRLAETYSCYQALFGRDSYDDAGATLISSVHYNAGYNNAYWDGTQMVYGDGDGVKFLPLGRDGDVTTHELTHAVTSSESNLTYSGESGGLNEAMSDIFASVCESWASGTWSTAPEIFMIAEDIWTPGMEGDALRYMDDPTRDGKSLDFYGNYYSGADVHYSSGIANLVFALLSKGGTHPRGKTSNSVPAIGPEKAGRIFYKANTELFTASTTFEQAKTYTVQAAEALYGLGSAEAAAVTEAWMAVGVPAPPPVSTEMTNGLSVSGLSGITGDKVYFTLEVPEGQSNLTFNLGGGTGDADLYVRYGAAPTSTTYDCRPYKGGNVESCAFVNPQAGTWYVMVNGFASFADVGLEGIYGQDKSVTETLNGTVDKRESDSFGPYRVVPGTTFKVVMTGAGNSDLYVRFGAQPSTRTYDCRSDAPSASETCTLTVPAGQSSAYVMVRGVAWSSYSLSINYTLP